MKKAKLPPHYEGHIYWHRCAWISCKPFYFQGCNDIVQFLFFVRPQAELHTYNEGLTYLAFALLGLVLPMWAVSMMVLVVVQHFIIMPWYQPIWFKSLGLLRSLVW